MQSTFAMLTKLSISNRHILKFELIFWAVLLICSSVTVFGLELTSGQRIYLGGASYVIDQKIGQGASADIYRLHLENNPAQEFVMRSPRFSSSALPSSTQEDVTKFQMALEGFNLIISTDPDGEKWLWTPKTFEVPLNPHRRILESERKLGWDKTHSETVIVMPLAKGSMVDLRNDSETFQDVLHATTKIYTEILPELHHLINAKLVHGDIKPGNILIDKNGKAGISDFEGIVTQGQNTFWKTRNFMAPETSIGGPLSYAADLYSTAKTLLWAMIPPEQWLRVGHMWDISYSSFQYEALVEYIDKIEAKVRASSYQDIKVELEMLKFIRYALIPDPIKRIISLKKNVAEFKNISIPTESVMLKNLSRQSLTLNAMKTARNVLAAIEKGYNKLTTRKQYNQTIVGAADDAETITAFNEEPAGVKDLAVLKSNLIRRRFSEKHLEDLKTILIQPTERDQLMNDLNSRLSDTRAWAALRLMTAGETSEKIMDVFLVETSRYLNHQLITKISSTDLNNKTTIDHLISLLNKEVVGSGTYTGLLDLLGAANLKLVLENQDAPKLLMSNNKLVRSQFTRFYIQQNYDLTRLTDIVVKACINGDGSALLDNLNEFKPYLTRSQMTMLFNSAIDHLSKGSLDSQKVVAQLGTGSKQIMTYIKLQHPGYQLNEITGLFRYRQSPLNPVSSCHSFYGK